MFGNFFFSSVSNPATRVTLVVLSLTPGSSITLPLPPRAAPNLSASQAPLATPGCFWNETKLFPTFHGSRLSGLFHQIETNPFAFLTALTMIGASELDTVFTNITTVLP